MEKILWVDLEMTGLDVEKEVILEVAALVTDLSMQEIDRYHSIVHQPQEYLNAMDDWNKKHHGESGLLSLVPSGQPLDKVELDLLGILDKHFKNERAVLAGNSIGQDRLFINKYMTRFAGHLHYRMLDVSSFKLVFVNLFGISYQKKNSHRAVEDIQESIAELQFYLSHVPLKPKSMIS